MDHRFRRLLFLVVVVVFNVVVVDVFVGLRQRQLVVAVDRDFDAALDDDAGVDFGLVDVEIERREQRQSLCVGLKREVILRGKNNSLRKLLRTAPLKNLRNSKVIEEQGDGGKKVPEKNSFSFSRQCENRRAFIFFIEVQIHWKRNRKVGIELRRFVDR